MDEALAGHIYAVTGLKDTTTGETLSDPQAPPIVLESMSFPPDPVIQVAVEPKTKADQEKLASRSRSSPRRTRPSRSTRTTRVARPFSPVWESCTSRCWSTV